MIEPRPDVSSDQETWPRFFDAAIVEDGQFLEVMVREFDGTMSSLRINIRQVAD